MKIKFWGVRGSSATPERRNSRYGGNTSCVEVRLANGTLIILDCGTGVRTLGKSLLQEFGDRAIRGYIFLTHFHWDHIQGIPFFPLFYTPRSSFFFHSAGRKAKDLAATLGDQMTSPYFPVGMSAMTSARHFLDLDEEPINLNGAMISSAPLNHPQGSVAYRIEADGGVFVLATDTEPGSPVHDKALRELCGGADLLAYDAQFTPQQLRGEKKGWGHSSWLEGTRIARECGVKRLLLFHHDPDHDDGFVDGLVENARHEFLESSGATEGMEISVPARTLARKPSVEEAERRRERRYTLRIPARVQWKAENGDTLGGLGSMQNLSRSGVYFIAPLEVPSGRPIQVAAVLPGEITHRGDAPFEYLVQPVRRDLLRGGLGVHASCAGIGARLIQPS